jgi:hypothetical protein
MAQSRAGQRLRDRVEIWDDVPLDPVDNRVFGFQRQVKLVAVIGDEREAEESPADAVVFCVEEIAHTPA